MKPHTAAHFHVRALWFFATQSLVQSSDTNNCFRRTRGFVARIALSMVDGRALSLVVALFFAWASCAFFCFSAGAPPVVRLPTLFSKSALQKPIASTATSLGGSASKAKVFKVLPVVAVHACHGHNTAL
jgi:hypothetical protein